MAWIAQDVYADTPRREVHKHDADGAAELDAGTAIGRSLTLSGSTVGWLNGGETRTAVLR